MNNSGKSKRKDNPIKEWARHISRNSPQRKRCSLLPVIREVYYDHIPCHRNYRGGRGSTGGALPVGSINWNNHFGKEFGIVLWGSIIIFLNHPMPRFLPKKAFTCILKDMCENVHSSTMCGSKNTGTPINKITDVLWYTYSVGYYRASSRWIVVMHISMDALAVWVRKGKEEEGRREEVKGRERKPHGL
jgi:hypothetical protein